MRRALGKSLAHLLSDPSEKAKTVPPTKPSSAIVDILDAPVGEIALSLIQPNPGQPRTEFDDEKLQELADSIQEVGVIQPIIVRPIGNGRYQIIAGERRYRASLLAKKSNIPAIIRTADAQTTLELALIENVQREDITSIECARAYHKLVDEFGMGHEQLGRKLGKSRVTISNTIRLLKLPSELQEALSSRRLTEGHARALLMVENPVAQMRLAERAMSGEMSVREIERAVKATSTPRTKHAKTEQNRPKSIQTPDHAALESKLSEYFGTPVRLEPGSMTIRLFSDQDLTRILDALGISL